MSSDALAVHQSTLAAQLGEESPVTVRAILDPSGTEEATVYGWLEEHEYNGDKDSGNVTQKRDGKRFVCATIPAFDVYLNLQIYFPDTDETYLVQSVDRDKHGAQVLWLY